MSKRSPLTFAGLMLGPMLLPAALSAAVIYHQDFDPQDDTLLNGTAPTVDNSGNDVVWDANGSTKLNGATPANTSNWLPYTFGSGVYTLEAKARIAGGDSTEWFAIGFSSDSDGDFGNGGFTSSSTNAYYWLIQRRNGAWAGFGGVANNNTFNTGTVAQPSLDAATHLKIVFDNTDEENRTIAMYLNGTQLDLDPNSDAMTRTVTLVPAGVGWGKSNPGSSTVIESFTLSVVPEPGITSILGLGALGLLARRQRSRA